MGMSIHKIELANCGSSNQPANLQGLDFGTRSQVNNLVARNDSITAKMWVNVIVCDMLCMKYARIRIFTDPHSFA